MPRRRCRVVCGRLEVMAMRAPTNALSKVDLPTFGFPTMATWPQRNASGAARSGVAGLFIGLRGSGLLGRAPAGAGAGRGDVQRSDTTDNLEGLQMGLPADGDDGVFGYGEPSPLQPFLQPRLGVLGDRVGRGGGNVGHVAAFEGGVSGRVAAVGQDGTAHRLDR